MNFTYSNFSLFSKIEARMPTLRSELGQYTMDFDLQFTPHNPPKGAVIVDNLGLSVFFGDKKHDVGVAYPAPIGGMPSVIALRRQPHGQMDINGRFRLYLTPAMLEAIEAFRNARDAKFDLKVFGTITGYDSDVAEANVMDQNMTWNGEVLLNAAPARIYRPQRAFQDVVLTIPQSRWVEILNGAGFNKTVLLEIPILETDELGIASSHIKEAQSALIQGRYADVVARCRDALDTLISKLDCPWEKAVNHESRKQMTVEESFRLSWGTARQITHATHHRNNMKSEFTRPMAQYVLGATCLALSLASKERELFVEPKSIP